MITCFVDLLPDGGVYIKGRLRNEECDSGHFRQGVHEGGSYLGIEFDEWRTLSSVTFGDDGSVTKELRGEPVEFDPNAERPPFLRNIP
ncbi:MAG: hypothetical protein PHH47_10175 [Gallionella sp.]|nr:hypothetical protein [Gallionella sp.]MDD4946467.1 hypothetical protein [Gallionella sp.]